MNQLVNFSIGFGNDQGQTILTLLQQKKTKIQLFNIKAAQIQPPIIEIKKYNPINLGSLQDCIRKKKDRQILANLLKIQTNIDINALTQKCSGLQNKVSNDLALLGAMMQQNKKETQLNNFKTKTKCTQQEAKKYLTKYTNCQEAIKNYLKHQEIIKKFMQQYQCTKQNAIQFLENNDYQML